MKRVVTNSKNKPTPASRFRTYTPPNEGVVNISTDDVEFRGQVDFTNATVIGIQGTVPAAYTLPATDGTAGQVLETDGSGVVTWETPSAGASYLSYVASWTQTGTDAPTLVTIFENTLGGVPTISRGGTGLYNFLLTGAFPENKTTVEVYLQSTSSITAGVVHLYGGVRGSDNSVSARFADSIGDGVDIEGAFLIVIKVYP